MAQEAKFGKKEIWKVFIFLSIVTAIEFVIAFTMGDNMKTIKNILFVVLTLVKAYGIMAFFMHLKFEFSNFKMTILVPFAFIVFLLVILAYEGSTLNLWSFLEKF
jgi:cytochrome c oxidase subunit IV